VQLFYFLIEKKILTCKLNNNVIIINPLRLFAFSLIGHAKDWLQCLSGGIIQTGNELEDKFLERFFTHNQFQKRSDIMNFKQLDQEFLYKAYERIKLLKRKCPNHMKL
jgi:hypothetical protein